MTMGDSASAREIWQNLCLVCSTNVYSTPDFGGENGLYYDLEICEFRNSRSSGCIFCEFLNDTFTSRYDQWESWTKEEGWLYITFGIQNLLSVDDKYGGWHDGMGCVYAMVEFDILEGTAVHSPRIRLGDDDLLLIISHEVSDPNIKTKDDRVSFEDPDCFEIARTWLQTCRSQHSRCASTQKGRPKYPSRLLQIASSVSSHHQDVKLIDTSTLAVMPEYFALSYCWGGPQEFSTKSTNLRTRQGGFSSNDLKGSVFDAIQVARALDIHHLWIDAICILQDVGEDKLNEIPAMGEIYEQALATVIAESTSVATDGFLKSFERKIWHLPYLRKDDSRSTIEIHQISNLRSVLRSRAWTMQESMLSNRKIVFGSNTISWICSQHEDIDLRQRVGPVQPTMDIFDPRGPYANPQHSHGRLAADAWLETLEDYTNREMSAEEDKLLAISGLAARVAKQMSWSYAAGFWKEALEISLVWSVNSASIHRGSLKRRVTRPSRYLAPTWSWASIIGPIEWTFIHSVSPHRLCFEVKSCHVKIENVNAPYGQVLSGQIVLSGPLIRLPLIDVQDIKSAQNQQSCFFQLPILTLQSQTWITADTVDSLEELCGYCFFLILCTANPRARYPEETVDGPMSTFESKIWASLSLQEGDTVCQPCPTYSTSSFEGLILKPDLNDTSVFRRVGHWRAEARTATINLLKQENVTLV